MHRCEHALKIWIWTSKIMPAFGWLTCSDRSKIISTLHPNKQPPPAGSQQQQHVPRQLPPAGSQQQQQVPRNSYHQQAVSSSSKWPETVTTSRQSAAWECPETVTTSRQSAAGECPETVTTSSSKCPQTATISRQQQQQRVPSPTWQVNLLPQLQQWKRSTVNEMLSEHPPHTLKPLHEMPFLM